MSGRPAWWRPLPGCEGDALRAVPVEIGPSLEDSDDNRAQVARWCGGTVEGLGDVRVPSIDGFRLLAGPGDVVVEISVRENENDPRSRRRTVGFTVVAASLWRAVRYPQDDQA